MKSYDDFVLRSRRGFLTSTASGIGLLALASMFRDDGLLAADSIAGADNNDAKADPLWPKPPHFAAESQAMHLHLSGGRAQPDGSVRPQAHAQRAQWSAAAGEPDQGSPLRIHPEGIGHGHGKLPQVRQTRRMRHGVLRLAAAHRDLRRRHRDDPLDAHRGVQPSSGPVDDEHWRAAIRPAQHGFVDQLRLGKRVALTAGICRADKRPRHEWRGQGTGQAGFYRPPTPVCCFAIRANRC